MSEPTPTGYRESPDTADDAPAETRDDDVPLTTDPEAQRDDSIARPGNQSD